MNSCREIITATPNLHQSHHGFVPGLVKTPAGYAVIEDHIAFKLTRDRALKEQIARAAVKLVDSGMRIALDGGSTTLPIAEQIAAAIDADLLSDLLIITNSISVAQRLADLVERRGWLDEMSPVQLLICGGRIRAVTKAVAEMSESSSYTRNFVENILQEVGGIDCCFVGANGLTAQDGLTMPTAVELSTKRQFIEAAATAYVVADITKFGQRHPIKIADWNEQLTVLTNRPRESNPELERILAMQATAKVVLANDDDD
jgi:DeoR/GlpR family transcriptional regulator of sugar metabolism